MKIALLGPFYPFRGGISYFLELLAKNLRKKNFEVKLFNFINQYPDIIFPGKNQFDKDKKEFDFPNIRVLTPYNPFTWSKTTQEIINFNPDLLILKYWIPFFALSFGYIVSKIKKKSNIRVFYIIDNLDFHEKWIAANYLTHIALKDADALITMSNSVKQDAIKHFPHKKIIEAFHPVYVGYNRNKFTKISARAKLKINNNAFVILFFGFIKKYKGVDNLIKAFKIINATVKNSYLLIAGEVYGDSKEYYQLIENLSLKEYVIFKNDYIEESEVEKYFKASDLLVLPYKHATQSGILNIAYDMNLPVVATPVGGLPEAIKKSHTGIISKSIKPQAIADAIKEFLTYDKNQFIENIKKEKEKYSWERFVKIITSDIK